MYALFPMKMNSQRVPKKNFRKLYNKPLFRWMLDKLLICDKIEKVIINSDAIDLIETNLPDNSEKIILHERPKYLCGDEVSMNRILKYDIEKSSCEHFIMTHTTNPFISIDTIDYFIEKYFKSLKEGYDSLFSADLIQMRFYDKQSNPINHDPHNLIQTQDLEEWYAENSCLYCFSKNSFNLSNNRIGNKSKIFKSNKIESLDIDNEEDWIMAEYLAKNFSL